MNTHTHTHTQTQTGAHVGGTWAYRLVTERTRTQQLKLLLSLKSGYAGNRQTAVCASFMVCIAQLLCTTTSPVCCFMWPAGPSCSLKQTMLSQYSLMIREWSRLLSEPMPSGLNCLHNIQEGCIFLLLCNFKLVGHLRTIPWAMGVFLKKNYFLIFCRPNY